MYKAITQIDWEQLADMTAVITAPAILLAVVISAYQIVSQLSVSRRQSAFDVYIQFTERFSDLLELRSSIRSRASDLDVTLDENCVKQFYNRYWHLQMNEWEMFRAGLLPAEIFATWLCYTHDSIVGNFTMPYFKNRVQASMSAKRAFEEIAISQMMRSNAECRAFFCDLRDIPFAAMRDRPSDGSLDERLEMRRAHIVGLLQRASRSYRGSKAWKLA